MIKEWRIKAVSKIISDVFFVDNAEIDISYAQGEDFPNSINIYLDTEIANEENVEIFKTRIDKELTDFEYYFWYLYDNNESWISLRFIGKEQ